MDLNGMIKWINSESATVKPKESYTGGSIFWLFQDQGEGKATYNTT